MKIRCLMYLIFLLPAPTLSAQELRQNVNGQVSFLSSQNVYVRFNSTKGISVHDTLYISSENRLVPVLVVNELSQVSCLCTTISTTDLPVGHLIIARARTKKTEPAVVVSDTVNQVTLTKVPEVKQVISDTNRINPPVKAARQGRHETISGSLSAASYSDFSNTGGPNDQRFRYTLSLLARNISGSHLSADVYISFQHRSGAWDEIRKNIFNGLKIYALALNYDIDSTTRVKLGRQVNPRLSNIGSFDGLTFEKSLKGFTFGLTGGARPDYLTYGFNFKLPEYGGYVAYDRNVAGNYSSTSLAFMQQMFSRKTDRRFLYFQHSGSIAGGLSFFGSFEADLFKLVNNTPSTSLDLTSLYLYLNYRFSSSVSAGISYDARKNPVYYETNRTLLDTLRENALRQSYRIRANIRLTKNLMLGVNSSYRYLKTDIHQSKDAGGYLTYSFQTKNFMSLTLSGDYLSTSYINGYSGNLSFLSGIAGGKGQIGAGYRYQQYRLPEGSQNLTQHTGNIDLYWQILKKLSLSADYELTVDSGNKYNRFYLQLLKRF